MRRVAAVALTLTSPATGVAQQGRQAIAPRVPEQAAGQALMSCMAHSMGTGPIIAANAEALASDGLMFSEAYPSFLQGQSQNEFGRASFARVPVTDGGQIWAAGYDSGVCIVTVIGTPEGPVVARLQQLFSIPGGWKQKQIKDLPGRRWSAYDWNSPQAKLTAQLSITDLPPNSPAKGFVSVTIVPKSKVN